MTSYIIPNVVGIIVLILLAILQAYLSMTASRKICYLLPAVAFLLAVAMLGFIVFISRDALDAAEVWIIYLFVVYNIPTIIFISIHAFFTRKRKLSRELDVMRAQDLGSSSITESNPNPKSKMWLIPFVLVGILIVALLLSFQGSPYNQSAIYNDDSVIAKQADSYTSHDYTMYVDDNGIGTLSMSRFTGDVTICNFTVGNSGGEVLFDYDMAVTSGKFKLVWVENNDTVSLIAEGSDSGSIGYTLSSGEYAIKAVGVNGKSQISFTMTVTGDIER